MLTHLPFICLILPTTESVIKKPCVGPLRHIPWPGHRHEPGLAAVLPAGPPAHHHRHRPYARPHHPQLLHLGESCSKEGAKGQQQSHQVFFWQN